MKTLIRKPRSLASDLDLLCLLRSAYPNTYSEQGFGDINVACLIIFLNHDGSCYISSICQTKR